MNRQSTLYKQKMATTSKILKSHIGELKSKGVQIENERQLERIVEGDTGLDIKLSEGLVHIVDNHEKVIEVPVHDEKNQELIRHMSSEIARIYEKYPKIKKEANPKFVDLLSRDVVSSVDNNGLNKIVEIIKYTPEVVKVENTYTYNADKQRRTEFHQKVLLKSLLQEFERIKSKTGVAPEIDEEVITMINEEIKDTGEVDDILRCFQVNHKIVEVPKIVEKIVERVVEIPTIIPI